MVETGEAREVHHHCLLVGYGADAINPYLAFEALWQARARTVLRSTRRTSPDDERWSPQYRKGVAKGMLKVMAKMGISTLQSYKGAQIFEALGLDDEVIDRCFAGTASRIQGVGFDVLAEEALRRHGSAIPSACEDRLRGAAQPGRVPLARRRRAPHVGPAGDRRPPGRRPRAAIEDAYRRFAEHINARRARSAARCAAC